MSDQDRYAENMSRDATEAQRMDQQFTLITSALGWLIHPTIQRVLQSDAKIADIGTGTGLFLHTIADSYPQGTLDGYDVSSAMFTSSAKNVKLSVADAKKPFPEELHNTYDLVHVRYLIAAMQPNEWEPVLRNLLLLLKPGGAIQWTESAISETQYLRGGPDTTTTAMTMMKSYFTNGPLKEQFRHGWSTLPSIMEKCGLTVKTDIVSSDRKPETRRVSTENAKVILFAYARMMAKKNAPGSMSLERINELEAAASVDIESGCYTRYDVHTAIGFKPAKSQGPMHKSFMFGSRPRLALQGYFDF